jgi:hypothetical protein
MAVSKKNAAAKKTAQAKQTLEGLDEDNLDVGLLANGSARSWEVSIDETIMGPNRWFAQIEGPLAYLYCEIPSLEIIGKTVQFLTAPQTAAWSQTTGTLTIGAQGRTSISLVRDDEHPDRFFLVVGSKASPTLRLAIAGTDLAAIVEALRQVEADLKDE